MRDAVLETLAHDEDARVRSAAIGLLEPVQSDSSVAAGAADGFDAG